MPEVNQYVFSHKEIVEMLIKAADIHEGKWTLSVTFAFAAINGGPTPDQVMPSAIAGVQTIGIQRALPDAPDPITVDAAKINPAQKKRG